MALEIVWRVDLCKEIKGATNVTALFLVPSLQQYLSVSRILYCVRSACAPVYDTKPEICKAFETERHFERIFVTLFELSVWRSSAQCRRHRKCNTKSWMCNIHRAFMLNAFSSHIKCKGKNAGKNQQQTVYKAIIFTQTMALSWELKSTKSALVFDDSLGFFFTKYRAFRTPNVNLCTLTASIFF